MSQDQHEHHIVPSATYLKILLTLLLLTVITVWAAQIDFGFMNTVIAMFIATVKACLVMAIFMHLKYEGMLNRVIIANGFFFLLVFFVFCALDLFLRVKVVPQ